MACWFFFSVWHWFHGKSSMTKEIRLAVLNHQLLNMQEKEKLEFRWFDFSWKSNVQIISICLNKFSLKGVHSHAHGICNWIAHSFIRNSWPLITVIGSSYLSQSTVTILLRIKELHHPVWISMWFCLYLFQHNFTISKRTKPVQTLNV